MVYPIGYFLFSFALFLNCTILTITQKDIDLVVDLDDEEELSFNQPKAVYSAKDIIPYLIRLPKKNCPVDGQTILDADQILRNDLYLYTHPFNQRSLLDMPQYYFAAYRDWLRLPSQPWQMTFQFFYNQTHGQFFTQTSDIINSYLAISNPNFTQGLNELSFDINLLRVFEILGGAQVYQYRVGVMMDYQYLTNHWWIQWRIPVEYMVRHFNLTQLEQDDLRIALAQSEDPQSETDFARRHLIADRAGLGDLRLDIGYKFVDDHMCTVYSGLEATLPFAWAFKKGPYGNHFKKNAPIPQLDLINLLNLATSDLGQAQYIGTEFLLASLDRLSRILLETGLGNNGHVGVGWFCLSDMQVSSKLHFKTRGAIEYLIPAVERRFYIEKKDLAEFDAIAQDPLANCEQSLRFLEKQLINTLFPQGYNTRIWPGLLVKITTALAADMGERSKLTLGYDLWYQQRESLGSIHALAQQVKRLRKSLARTPQAFQSKFFAGWSYAMHGGRFDWSLAFWGDVSFISSGIGRDFNLGLSFELLV